jgi:hypothetical protein
VGGEVSCSEASVPEGISAVAFSVVRLLAPEGVSDDAFSAVRLLVPEGVSDDAFSVVRLLAPEGVSDVLRTDEPVASDVFDVTREVLSCPPYISLATVSCAESFTYAATPA